MKGHSAYLGLKILSSITKIKNISQASTALIFQQFQRDATQRGMIKAYTQTHIFVHLPPSFVCIGNCECNYEKETEKHKEGAEGNPWTVVCQPHTDLSRRSQINNDVGMQSKFLDNFLFIHTNTQQGSKSSQKPFPQSNVSLSFISEATVQWSHIGFQH